MTTTSRSPLRTVLGLASLVTLVGALACGGGDPTTESDSIRVGAVFDLSGPTSDVGTAYANGIRGYIDWLNSEGGVAMADGTRKTVELLYQDYAYKVDQAEQLYSRYVQQGVVAFQGWGTADTEALRGRIAEDEIPFMSASLSHVLGDPKEAPFNFLPGTSYTDQFKVLLDWIVETDGADGARPKVALMHNPSPFGLSPYNAGGKDYADSLGIELTKDEMPRGSTDFTAELTRIAQSGATWVVFQNTSGPVSVALRNARDLGLDLQFACLNWCSNAVLTDLAGDAANGVLGSILFSPPGPGVTGLDAADAFLQTQGSSIAEEGLLYGQGWMTMHLMAEGIRRAASEGDVTGAAIKTALESLRDFDTGGVTAPITYTEGNHRSTDSMRIFEVRDGAWAPLTDLRAPASDPDPEPDPEREPHADANA